MLKTTYDDTFRRKHVYCIIPFLSLQGQVCNDLIFNLLNLLSKKRSNNSVWKCSSELLWEKITNFLVSQSMVVKLAVFFTIIGEFDHRSLEMNLINQHLLQNYSIFLHEVIVSSLPVVIRENFFAVFKFFWVIISISHLFFIIRVCWTK